jgi:SAM-dependent methyltransferase
MFLDLGNMPLANALLKKEALSEKEPSYPLDVMFCEKCGMVQLGNVVDPDKMFKDYVYFTSMSTTITEHFHELAAYVAKRFSVPTGSLVVDIGSNDGTLLKGYDGLGLKVLGIEPAANIAEFANKAGVETVNGYFTESLARSVRKEKGTAKIITATNVFAHVNDLYDFVRGVKELLDSDGIFIIEAPYIVDFVRHAEFDTVYHEHLSYLGLRPLKVLFSKFGMEIFDVQRFENIHGGTMRYYVKKSKARHKITENVEKYVALELSEGLDRFQTYSDFSRRVGDLKSKLMKILKDVKADGKKIVGYGAAAKGNILLNYFRIGTDLLDYIVDKAPSKQGLYTPGTHIPIYKVERLLQDSPDYVLILPWNFSDEIMSHLKSQGFKGKFIIPLPSLRVI